VTQESHPKARWPGWDYNWGPVAWVHLKTRIKSRPEYIGFVDDDEGPSVYLIRPQIRSKEGQWLDSWTWREKVGPLPEHALNDYFGEVIVYKWDITEIEEVDYPGEIDRCWFCGKKVSRGRFCEPRHEFVFRMMRLDLEMLPEHDNAPRRWVSKDRPLQLERQYDIRNIASEIRRVKVITEKKFARKINIISKLIEYETKLSGIYFEQCMTKERIGVSYKENPILNNTLANQPYRSLSALLLIRNTLYGAARPIFRQCFESALMAKFAEINPDLAKRWDKQTEFSRGAEQVMISRDVLSILEARGKKVESLRVTWQDLCAMTHATRQSMQMLRAPDPDDPVQFEEYLKASNYFSHVEYSLDMLFLMLVMNYHLIVNHLAKKADRWWFGNIQDPYGSFKREKKLRVATGSSIKTYFQEAKKIPGGARLLRDNIREYGNDWAK
jgi:hypothetical protein